MSSSLPVNVQLAPLVPLAPLAPPAPDLPTGLRLPAALVAALMLEAGLIAMAFGWHAAPPPPPAPAPVKVARLVTIADVPGEPDPVPPPPQQSAPKPKPTPPKAKPEPAPKPVANAPSAAPTPAPAPTADAKPAEAPAPAPAPSPAQRDKAPEKPSGVRRGLVPLVRVEPDYPPRALASNTEGVVVARATIEADGSVSAVKIVGAQPAKLFDQEAIRALMRWKFSPNDGGMVGEIELRFRLSN